MDSSGEKSSRESDTGSERFCTTNDLDLTDSPNTELVLLLEKKSRLIDWNADILQRLLQQIVASRQSGAVSQLKQRNNGVEELSFTSATYTNPFDEVKEIIEIPQIKQIQRKTNDGMVTLSNVICNQLRDYVSSIADLYKQNEFHNFEHVSVHETPTKKKSKLMWFD